MTGGAGPHASPSKEASITITRGLLQPPPPLSWMLEPGGPFCRERKLIERVSQVTSSESTNIIILCIHIYSTYQRAVPQSPFSHLPYNSRVIAGHVATQLGITLPSPLAGRWDHMILTNGTWAQVVCAILGTGLGILHMCSSTYFHLPSN